MLRETKPTLQAWSINIFRLFLRWCPFLYFSLLGNYKITTECDDNCCMLVCLFTFFPLLFKHCTAASQTFSKTTGVNKEICMIILGALLKKWRQNFHIRRNHFGLGGTQIGFCCFLFIYQVSKRLWQKIDPNYKSTTVFQYFQLFFFGLTFSCQTFHQYPLKDFR